MTSASTKRFVHGSLRLFALAAACSTAESRAEDSRTYHLDVRGVEKEILEGHLKMGTPSNPAGDTITANSFYLLRNGDPWLPVMGEVQYSRYPRRMWRDALLKTKSGGIDILATYTFWNHHEEVRGRFDWEGQRNLRAFLRLCHEADLMVVLRIGPWCHGEARHGGFPDWVQAMPGRRSDDPAYLARVRRLYEEIFEQSRGMLYADGGPVIGIQLENEFSGPPEHIVTLKRIAREVGFDVPLYTETGWGVEVPKDEVLPVFGGYPDAPWAYGTERLEPSAQYLFRQEVPVDVGIGTDVLPPGATAPPRAKGDSRYPTLMAEVGLGNQVHRKRRPIITADDAATLSLIKLAGGANLLGYYTYHGGANPPGKTVTLNEPGYPESSYDFQTAISEYGEVNDKYHRQRLLHYWLQDFGHDLAPMLPVLPRELPESVSDTATLRCMARSTKAAAYLFLSNYQRYVENQPVGPQRLEVRFPGERLTLPSRPFTLPADATAIWPVNARLRDAVLRWSTTPLICRTRSESAHVYFFASTPGVDPEYVFDGGSVAEVDAGSGEVRREQDVLVVDGLSPAIDCWFKIVTGSGERVRICTLPPSVAKRLYRFHNGDRPPTVVIADGVVLRDEDTLEVLRIGEPARDLFVCPPSQGVGADGEALAVESRGLFARWRLPTDGRAGEEFDVALAPRGERPTRWELTIPEDALRHVDDLYLEFDYVGNVARVHDGGLLLGDHYYYGPPWRPSVKHWRPHALGKKLQLSISPITPDTWVYLEPEARPNFAGRDAAVELRSFSIHPQYRTIVRVNR